MAGQGEQQLAARQRPNFGSSIGAGGCQAAAIGAEGHAGYQPIVTLQCQQLLAGRGVPNFSCPIEAGSGDQFSIRAEYCIANIEAVAG